MTPERLAEVRASMSDHTQNCDTSLHAQCGVAEGSWRCRATHACDDCVGPKECDCRDGRDASRELLGEVERLRAAFERLAAYDWSHFSRFGSAGAQFVGDDVRRFAMTTLGPKAEPTSEPEPTLCRR